jgi:hypothetical protein
MSHQSHHSASVAHEGNPRTNTLTISGTLDGDIFLIPLPPSPDPFSTEPRPLPPEVFGEPSVSSNDALKYVFNDFRFGTDGQNSGSGAIGAFEPNNSQNAYVVNETFIATRGTVLEFSEKDSIPMYGFVMSPSVVCNQRFIDNNNHAAGSLISKAVDHNSIDFFALWTLLQDKADDTPTVPGSRWGELPGNSAPAHVNMQTTAHVSALASGYPFSGVAVGVDPKSTIDDFTGIVAAFNWGNQTEYIMRYNHQPLKTLGTVIASIAWGVDYVINDRIRVQLSKIHGLNSAETWRILWNSTTITGLTNTDIPYYQPDMRSALINLPSTFDSGTDDAVTWTEVAGVTWAE